MVEATRMTHLTTLPFDQALKLETACSEQPGT